MKQIMRRALIGLFCGIVSSPFLCFALRSVGLGLALGALLGIAQVFAFFDLEGGSAIDRAMTAALGLPFWAAINVVLLPLLAGAEPQWTAAEMRALFPALIGWLLFCFFLGILSQAARRVSKYFLGPESPPRAPSFPAKTTQIVFLGGGFAGVTTAEHLEKQFRDDSTVSFAAREISGCGFPAQVAVNALVIYVKLSGHVFRVFIRNVGRRFSFVFMQMEFDQSVS